MANENLQDTNTQDQFVPGGADSGIQDQGVDQSQQQEQPQRRSVRDDLNDSFDQARQEQPQARKPKAAKAKAPAQADNLQPDRQQERRPDARSQAQQYRDDNQQDSQAQEQTDRTTGPPAAWAKEAKSSWNDIPQIAQAAIAKRESDIQKGVEQLKGHYAEIDEALQPHMQAIRHNGFTPGKAVGEMFGWFNHIANNPLTAFHDLAKSFGWDLNRLVQASYQQQEQEQAQHQQAQQEFEQIPPYMRQALEQNFFLNQRLTQHEQQMAAQNEARTHDVINSWAQGKTMFEEVRHTMGQLIASGAVPLKNGRVDLDGAYDMAVYALPNTRQKVLQSQTAAQTAASNAQRQQQRSAQQRQANNARARAASISSSAPGSANGIKNTQVQPGTSVRDSLMAAIAEHSDGA